jgi:hypothetical protein
MNGWISRWTSKRLSDWMSELKWRDEWTIHTIFLLRYLFLGVLHALAWAKNTLSARPCLSVRPSFAFFAGVLNLHDRGSLFLRVYQPAWPGVNVRTGVSTCMAGGHCSYGGPQLTWPWRYCSYGDTQPAWPGVSVPTGILNQHDRESVFLREYSTCMIGGVSVPRRVLNLHDMG